MTRQEFDTWIEQHYGELEAVAKRRIKAGADDVLQSAVAGMLASTTLATTPPHLAWPWAVSFVRQAAFNLRVSRKRGRALTREQKILTRAAAIQG